MHCEKGVPKFPTLLSIRRAVLEGWRASLSIVQSKRVQDAVAFLLEIDPEAWQVKHTSFAKHQLEQASELYLEREKEIAVRAIPGAQVVLASTNSLRALRSAFPNYYLDTKVFLEAMDKALK